MHKLYELKEMLCEELEEYGSKGKLDVGSLDVVDKLAHAVKNIDKIIECKEEEDGYSTRRYSRGYYMDGGKMMDDHSYARRRYSRAKDDFEHELRELMHDAPNEHIKQKIQSIMSEM